MILETALAAMLVTTAAAPKLAVQSDSSCLHTPGKESPQQRDRSLAALAATRAINTAESKFAAANRGKYGGREDLVPHLDAARYNLIEGADIAPGFSLTLDTFEKGYWFVIKDKTDPCGFSYISNKDGLIFVAQPIR
jgi:hypothetical protein